MFPRVVGLLLLTSLLGLAGCAGGTGTQPPTSKQARVTVAIAGSGTVTSTPAGIDCPGACTANFSLGTPLTLAATAASGFQFAGFGGACSGQTCTLVLSGNQSVSATFNASAAQVTVSVSGNGTVTSTPAGINCPTTCSASFNSGSSVTLTASPAAGSTFSGFSGACTGTTCQLTPSSGQNAEVTATFATTAQKQDLSAINHIIVMLQENRSFDEYFGHLPDYWKANGFPQTSNGTTFDGEPSNASNVDDTGATLNAYKIATACTENPSPSWNESHVDRNRNDSTSPNHAPMDGFVHTAGKDAAGFGFYDVLGHRAMGYYTGDQLNYYYFMASSFATSDSWFSPVMSRTPWRRCTARAFL